MGKYFTEIADEIKNFPYKVEKSSSSSGCLVDIDNKKYTPQEVSATLLQKIKKHQKIFWVRK